MPICLVALVVAEPFPLPPAIARAIPFVVAFAAMELLALVLVPWVMHRSTAAMNMPPPDSSVDPDLWKAAINVPAGGVWIGALERLLFYVAILSTREALVAAWRAFKVATKWEVWQNIIKIRGPHGLSTTWSSYSPVDL